MTWKSSFAHPSVDGDLQLLILPWPQAARTQEHDARLAVAQRFGEADLEHPARRQFIDFQVRRESLGAEPPRHLLDGGSVLRVVGQERVEA